MKSKKRILVAPLNWGLGHATRCIPIIDALIECDFEPVIASDGEALSLLKKEYPQLLSLKLPSYGISYSKNRNTFKLKMLKDSPRIIKAIKQEQKAVDQIIKKYAIRGIISDNRFGVRSQHLPSVFITHQINVLSGSTSWISSKLNQQMIAKFDECWVPDVKDEPNLSGKLGHLDSSGLKIKYLGPLTRFKKQSLNKTYDLMVLLSGPEPQRTFLEELLLQELQGFSGKILFVKGKIENQQTQFINGTIGVYNFMLQKELETAINQSDLIIARSGYTTIMDLAKLEKKAFFIPTPGQYEQEYLAKKLNAQFGIPFCTQKHFSLEKLPQVNAYKGFTNIDSDTNFKVLFSLF